MVQFDARVDFGHPVYDLYVLYPLHLLLGALLGPFRSGRRKRR